ncbi:CBS domain-containing protein [Saccharopolyspora hirsuta]|uniref:CBS domain-containing protein n=1 Tax=Saccharopolyspora hirsuta TaxID=1837 RepID=A0A5M7BD78_SACHI|nr:CBS domain-containing protein [Saccharopolyspora hirsuta]KAA5825484.1 CBS domain-containing protein [Saccharopolyspora hirsuta]
MSNANELASTPVVAVRPELDAMEALQEMHRRGVHHLAVVAADDVLGLVSASDLLFGIAAERPGEPVSVVSLCRASAPRVDAEDDRSVAARRMIEAGTDALLVMRGGQVCGVLTAVDLVRDIAQLGHGNPSSRAEGGRWFP